MKKIKNIIIRKIPANVHAEFKSRCASQNVSMQDVIIALIAEYVRDRRNITARQ